MVTAQDEQPSEHQENLQDVLGDSLKIAFRNWKALLGFGLPISLVAMFAVFLLWKARLGGDAFLYGYQVIEVIAVALFAALWVPWLEQSLEVWRWPRPFAVTFLWAVAGTILISVVAGVVIAASEALITGPLGSEITTIGAIAILKLASALAYSLTGALFAGWLVLGRKMPVFGALGGALKRQFHFFVICALLTIVSSLMGGLAGAAIGGILGFLTGYGLWEQTIVEFLAKMIFHAFLLAFSLMALHRVYPAFLEEPHAR